MLFAFFFLLACADKTLNYQCTCTQIAYEKLVQEQDQEEYLVGYQSIEDRSFAENICDTYENIQQAFEPDGVIGKGIESCENDMSTIGKEKVGAGNYAINCSCECTLISEC